MYCDSLQKYQALLIGLLYDEQDSLCYLFFSKSYGLLNIQLKHHFAYSFN